MQPNRVIIEGLMPKLREALAASFGPRFRGLILFGSEARGEATPESDLDFLVLLDHLRPAEDRRKVVEITYPLMLALPVARIIDAVPVEYSVFERQEFPLYRQAKAEGIPA